MNNAKNKRKKRQLQINLNDPHKFIDEYPEKTEHNNSLAMWVMLIFTALFLLFLIVSIAHLIITSIFF